LLATIGHSRERELWTEMCFGTSAGISTGFELVIPPREAAQLLGAISALKESPGSVIKAGLWRFASGTRSSAG
jgi:hypothetical protein